MLTEENRDGNEEVTVIEYEEDEHEPEYDDRTMNAEKLQKLIDSVDLQLRFKQKPYYEAVLLMRSITKKKCPYEKLFLLNEVKNSIVKNVQWFWSGINVEAEKISLTSD